MKIYRSFGNRNTFSPIVPLLLGIESKLHNVNAKITKTGPEMGTVDMDLVKKNEGRKMTADWEEAETES